MERQFRFLKNPVYLGPIYLQSKRRINALGYVFILALLVASYLEYRVRKSLREQNKYLVWPRGHKNYRPSLQTIFEVLDLIKVLIVDGERRYFPRDIDRQALEMVKWNIKQRLHIRTLPVQVNHDYRPRQPPWR